MRTVLMVLFDQVQSLDVTGPLEVFTGANTWRASRGEAPAYDIRTASLGGRAVRTSSGLRLTPDGDLREFRAPRPGLLIVPGKRAPGGPGPELTAWLRRTAAGRGAWVSVCKGAFLLAEAGLLAGRRVTTHWAYCEALAARYPEVTVEPDPIFVRDGNIATSAGVTAGIDLALALAEDDLGREAALDIARHLVVFLRRPGNQAQFSAQLAGQLASREPLRDVQRWIAEHPAADLSVETLAGRPACPRGSSPGPSRPRWACRRDATSTRSGWRRPGAAWRTPPTEWSRPPAPAVTGRRRRCGAPSSAPSASARGNTAAVSAHRRPPGYTA